MRSAISRTATRNWFSGVFVVSVIRRARTLSGAFPPSAIATGLFVNGLSTGIGCSGLIPLARPSSVSTSTRSARASGTVDERRDQSHVGAGQDAVERAWEVVRADASKRVRDEHVRLVVDVVGGEHVSCVPELGRGLEEERQRVEGATTSSSIASTSRGSSRLLVTRRRWPPRLLSPMKLPKRRSGEARLEHVERLPRSLLRAAWEVDEIVALCEHLERAVLMLREEGISSRSDPVAIPVRLRDWLRGHSRKATKPLTRRRVSIRASSRAARG